MCLSINFIIFRISSTVTAGRPPGLTSAGTNFGLFGRIQKIVAANLRHILDQNDKSFGRSLKQLVTALDELSGLGVGFISFQDNLDLTTAQGRLMFHIIGAMAEFERELIRERVKAGLDNARRKGKRLGRKPVPPIVRDKVVALLENDSSLSVRKIAKKIGISSGFVGRVLKEHRLSAYSA